MNLSMVYMTASSQEEAEKIAEVLVKERYAACVNLLGNIQSFYRWNNQVEKGSEVAFIAKTKTGMVSKLVQKVKELHSYECPCVISWELGESNPEYVNWLNSEVADPD